VNFFDKCHANESSEWRACFYWLTDTNTSFPIVHTPDKRTNTKKLARIETSSVCRQQYVNVFADCFCAVPWHTPTWVCWHEFATLVCCVKAAILNTTFRNRHNVIQFRTTNFQRFERHVWATLVQFYSVESTSSGQSNCNFTFWLQVVWKATTQVGAALVKKVDSKGFTITYVVARYSPRGNYRGHFQANVMPKKWGNFLHKDISTNAKDLNSEHILICPEFLEDTVISI